MKVQLSKSKVLHNSELTLSGSKSETNRLLLLQALYPNISLENISISDDSEVMQRTLNDFQFSTFDFPLFDVHHAGTAMRFLTAFFAIQDGKEVIITGSNRMKERPIQILVEALNQLGAEISYLENEGFPPIKIIGKKLNKSQVSLKANVSSQYISALLLIAPKLEHGLELTLLGEITSLPYIKMTLALLQEMGVAATFEANVISVKPKSTIQNSKFTIESDWSSASYFYSIVALSEIGTQITLSSFKENSLQGDSVLVQIYKNFGVETFFSNHQITIRKTENLQPKTVNLNLSNAPDIAQTVAVTCLGLGIGCFISELHTLKIKETDRLVALQNEISKFGASISITDSSLTLLPFQIQSKKIEINTYQDHRMAMAFAPLALKTPLLINDAEVVSKSFPDFWEKLNTLGFEIQEV
uniref:3-phosphoshikimate 1-carboxyvinyltransferase n=1 Tax=Flavobacterium sp. TaxID=239 RepID=UPI004049A81E